MSLFQELKRRNVFRVGIAYVVGAWLLLQFTEVITELLSLPPTIGPVVVALVAIGLPVALFLAWAYELTPEGVKRESEVDRSQSITGSTARKLNTTIMVMLALAVAYLLFDKFSGRGFEPAPTETALQVDTPPQPPTAGVPTPEVSSRSIAVLPFDNRSRLEDDEFFVDGIHDDLLTSLARIGSLKVISRTSVSKYQDTEKTIPEIASELGVATVMEGAVQRAGDVVRINVQLIDARTDEHLWAEIFDRELTTQNLFAIQSEISTAIAAALEATLTQSEQQRLADIPTESLPAYNAYLRARQAMARRSADSLRTAAREFDRAVQLDPDYALAWVGVSDVHKLLGQYSTEDPAMLMARRIEAADRALAIDDLLGEAHIARASNLQDLEQFEEAERAFRRGVELSPNYAPGHQWFGLFLTQRIDQVDEGVRHLDTALSLDPLSSIVQANRYDALALQGAFEQGRAQLQRLKVNDPDFAPLYLRLGGWPFAAWARLDEGIPHLRQAQRLDPGNPLNYWLEGLAWIALGDEQAAEQAHSRLTEMEPDHWSTRNVGILRRVRARQYAAAQESMRGLDERSRDAFITFQWTSVQIAVLSGDTGSARRMIEETQPGYLAEEQWDQHIAREPMRMCQTAWVLTQTGDVARGRRLLNQAATFLAEVAPRHIDFPERLPLGQCLAALGDREGALEHLEAQAALGYSWWNWLNLQWPMLDDLRDEPRFRAMLARLESDRDEQRANLRRLQAEGRL